MTAVTACTAPVGRRCAAHYTAQDEAVSGGPYPGDWLCAAARPPAAWLGPPDATRSLAAEAALQGADVRSALWPGELARLRMRP